MYRGVGRSFSDSKLLIVGLSELDQASGQRLTPAHRSVSWDRDEGSPRPVIARYGNSLRSAGSEDGLIRGPRWGTTAALVVLRRERTDAPPRLRATAPPRDLNASCVLGSED